MSHRASNWLLLTLPREGGPLSPIIPCNSLFCHQWFLPCVLDSLAFDYATLLPLFSAFR